MKTTTKKTGKETAFTIIELLTVMSIIVILLGLLVPAMNKAKIYAKTVNQKNQFHSIDVALELFKTDYEDYPPSRLDPLSPYYCGAMKLAEAVIGQDLLGFHPDSVFRQDLKDASGNVLYAAPDVPPPYTPFPDEANIKSRKGPYLQVDRANAYRLLNVFGPKQLGTLPGQRFALCDEYGRVTNKGTEGPSRIGTPVLYYRADVSGFIHDPNNPSSPKNIYDYRDNEDLINLRLPGEGPTGKQHPLDTNIGGDRLFYEMTKNYSISVDLGRPYRPDSYILISAGYDGEYGTKDDIFNFDN